MLVLPGVEKGYVWGQCLKTPPTILYKLLQVPADEKELVRFFFYQTTYSSLLAYINKSIYASLFQVFYMEKEVWMHQNFSDTTTSVQQLILIKLLWKYTFT